MLRSAIFGLVFALGALVSMALPANAVCAFGMGSCDDSNKLPGNYTLGGNPGVALTITSSKMIAAGGPMRMEVNYKVVKVNGNIVTVEGSAPQVPTGTFDITVNNGWLRIRDSFIFGGDWIRNK